jgi:hypothetical protein
MFKWLRLFLTNRNSKDYLLPKENEINCSQGLIDDFCLCCSSGLNCGRTKRNIKNASDEHLNKKDIKFTN